MNPEQSKPSVPPLFAAVRRELARRMGEMQKQRTILFARAARGTVTDADVQDALQLATNLAGMEATVKGWAVIDPGYGQEGVKMRHDPERAGAGQQLN